MLRLLPDRLQCRSSGWRKQGKGSSQRPPEAHGSFNEGCCSSLQQYSQLDAHHAVINTWRFVINSTIGLLGTIDVASRLGLPPYKNDFGLTLYKWGVLKQHHYLQIIFLGPSTTRDAIGTVVGYSLTPTSYITIAPLCYGIGTFRGIPTRANLLAADKLVDEALDPYIFVRDAYLQNRKETIKKMKEKPVKHKTTHHKHHSS